MKNLMLTTALVAVSALSASAQDMFRSAVDPMTISASDFIGMRVYASDASVDATEYAGVQDGWNDIGEINDVVLSRDGKIDSVLVDVGGFLGMGERQVALDMSAIRFVSDAGTIDNANDFFLVINATRTNIEGAPVYGMTDEAPAADSAMTEGTTAPADSTVAADGMGATEAPMVGQMEVDGYTTTDAAGLTTDELMGAKVYGPNKENVGEISKVVMNGDNAISQVIVDVGGFLGMGEKPVALDMSQVQVLRADGGTDLRAYVAMTKDQLEALPQAAM